MTIMKGCAIIPAYDAAPTVGMVVRSLLAQWPVTMGPQPPVFVIDDGSTDDTVAAAREAGARVYSHRENRGKGAALRTGLALAQQAGFDVAVTVDADGQHPSSEALRLLLWPESPGALVLGIRDLATAGAPKANQVSNRISNFFLSLFAGRPFLDTQCGLRRYPIARTLELGGRGDGYAFEAEIILRSVAAGVPIAEVPVRVFYPPEEDRVTHFDSVRDPARIVARVVETLVITRGMRRPPPVAAAAPIAADAHPPAERARPRASTDPPGASAL
jgi:glycosyltransferase involved in cell wall biosynthesis